METIKEFAFKFYKEGYEEGYEQHKKDVKKLMKELEHKKLTWAGRWEVLKLKING